MRAFRKATSVLACAALACALVPAVPAAPAAYAAAGEVVHVSTNDQLRALSERVNGGDTMEGVTVLLDADLDFASEEEYFDPIGSPQHLFKGTFDGQGHSVSNLRLYTINLGGTAKYLAPFGAANGATFKDFSIKGISVSCYSTALVVQSLLCCQMTGCTVENVDIYSESETSSTPNASSGGMCYSAKNSNFTNCSMTVSRSTAQGTFAVSATGSNYTGCSVNGLVYTNCSGKSASGALVGKATECSFSKCVNNASFTSYKDSPGYDGGIVGRAISSTITDCMNYGDILCTNEGWHGYTGQGGYTGGICGYLEGSTMERCGNYGHVKSEDTKREALVIDVDTEFAGGIVGMSGQNSTISQCVNASDMDSDVQGTDAATSYMAGLVGTGALTTMSDCYNIGSIYMITRVNSGMNMHDYVAGIIAVAADSFVCERCYTIGSLSAEYATESKYPAVLDAVCASSEGAFADCAFYRGMCAEGTAHKGASAMAAAELASAACLPASWGLSGAGAPSGAWRMDAGEYALPVLSWETAAHPAALEMEADISQAGVAVAPGSSYTGAPCEPAVSVSLGGRALEEGVDYEVSYSDNVHAGQAAAVVSGIGAYCGSAKASFQIAKAAVDLSGLSLAGGPFAYDGSEHSLSLSGELPAGVERLEWTGNSAVHAGAYTVAASPVCDADHEASGSLFGTLVVEPAASAMTAKAAAAKVRRGKSVRLKVSGASGKVTYRCSSKGVSVKNGKIVASKTAKLGACTVTVRDAGDADHLAKAVKVSVKVRS